MMHFNQEFRFFLVYETFSFVTHHQTGCNLHMFDGDEDRQVISAQNGDDCDECLIEPQQLWMSGPIGLQLANV